MNSHDLTSARGFTSACLAPHRGHRFSGTTLRLAAVCAVLIGAVASGQTPATSPRLDILIRGGTIIDGSGGAPYRADLGIAGRHIARIGDLTGADADTIIDASGLYVTPGFINIHSHAMPSALASAENMLTQGVTLEILNADGGGGLDLRKQLGEIAANGLALNVGANIGFNSAWSAVVGESDRRPSPATLPRPPWARSTDLPTADSRRSRAGSSLPDRRIVPTRAPITRAAATPSGVTTACDRGNPVMTPASRRSVCARAAVPGEQPTC